MCYGKKRTTWHRLLRGQLHELAIPASSSPEAFEYIELFVKWTLFCVWAFHCVVPLFLLVTAPLPQSSQYLCRQQTLCFFIVGEGPHARMHHSFPWLWQPVICCGVLVMQFLSDFTRSSEHLFPQKWPSMPLRSWKVTNLDFLQCPGLWDTSAWYGFSISVSCGWVNASAKKGQNKIRTEKSSCRKSQKNHA